MLVVEDDPVQRAAVCKLLASHELETVGASTAAECLEQLKRRRSTAWSSTCRFPIRPGYALLETLSREEAYSFPPVIVYTGRDDVGRTRSSGSADTRNRSSSRGPSRPSGCSTRSRCSCTRSSRICRADQQRMLEEGARSRRGPRGPAHPDRRGRRAEHLRAHPRAGVPAASRSKSPATARGASLEDSTAGRPRRRPRADGRHDARDGRPRPRCARSANAPSGRNCPSSRSRPRPCRTIRQKCLAAGAYDYIAKPLDVDKLLVADSGLDAAMNEVRVTTKPTISRLKLLLDAIYQRYHYDFRGYAMASLKRRLAQRQGSLRVSHLLAPAGARPARRDSARQAPLVPHRAGQRTVSRPGVFPRDSPGRLSPTSRRTRRSRFGSPAAVRARKLYSLAILLREEGLEERTMLYGPTSTESLRQAEVGIYPLDRMPLFTENHRRSGGKSSLSDYYTADYDAAVLDKTPARKRPVCRP